MIHRELLVQWNSYSWTLKRLYVKEFVKWSASFLWFFSYIHSNMSYDQSLLQMILNKSHVKNVFLDVSIKKNACNLFYIIVVGRNLQYYLFCVKLFWPNNQSYILIILLIDWLIEQFDITGNEIYIYIHSLHLHHVNKGLCYKAVVKTEDSGPLNLYMLCHKSLLMAMIVCWFKCSAIFMTRPSYKHCTGNIDTGTGLRS